MVVFICSLLIGCLNLRYFKKENTNSLILTLIHTHIHTHIWNWQKQPYKRPFYALLVFINHEITYSSFCKGLARFQKENTMMEQKMFMKDYNSSVILPPISNSQQQYHHEHQQHHHHHRDQQQQQQPVKPAILLPLPSSQQAVSNPLLWDYKFNNDNMTNSKNKPTTNHYIHTQDEIKAESLKRLGSVCSLGSENSFNGTYNSYNSKYNQSTHSPLPISLSSLSNDKMLDSHPVLPPLVSKTRSSSSPSLHERSSSLPSNSITQLSAASSHQSKISKPRKKKQCPQCHLFFSNLSTHKSTHLPATNRPYQCGVCSRGFSRSNDLYRHEKRHWKELGKGTEDAYKCPFSIALLKEKRLSRDESIKDLKDKSPCHSSGIFSRCDTYKNHLKALHFEYPPGTKKKFRNGMHGKCKKCGMSFDNVDDWLNNHVEAGLCGYKF